MLVNLVDNAVKYSDRVKDITVRVGRSGGSAHGEAAVMTSGTDSRHAHDTLVVEGAERAPNEIARRLPSLIFPDLMLPREPFRVLPRGARGA